MNKVTFENGTLFVADDFFIPGCSTAFYEFHNEWKIRSFTRRILYRDIIDLYGRANGLRGYTMLHAHGMWRRKGPRPHDWEYDPGNKKPKKIQNWIDRHDGKSLVLFLYCCNPYHFEITAKKSIVLHADKTINFLDAIRGCMRMYVPGAGYVDRKSYKAGKVIRSLQEQIWGDATQIPVIP